LLAIIPSVFLSKISEIVDYTTNVLIIFSFTITVSLLRINRDIIKKVLNIISVGILIPVIIHLSGVFVFDFNNLLPINEPYISFKEIGLNVSRTGWSASLALFIPILFIKRSSFSALLFSIPVLTSQFISGGRGGLLAGVVTVILILINRKNYRIIAVLGMFIIAAVVAYSDELSLILRLNRLSQSEGALNSFSAGRIDSYIASLKLLLNNPVFGIGYGNMDLTTVLKMKNVHNAFLLLITELGIFSFLFFIGIFLLLQRLFTGNRKLGIPTYVPIIALFVLMMLEPSVLFRSFQNSFGFWAYYFIRTSSI
jgi:O-antigen ligase